MPPTASEGENGADLSPDTSEPRSAHYMCTVYPCFARHSVGLTCATCLICICSHPLVVDPASAGRGADAKDFLSIREIPGASEKQGKQNAYALALVECKQTAGVRRMPLWLPS
jgi:hypothetical protein